MAQKKGRYSTYITNRTKFNETKPIEVIFTAVNSKLTVIVIVIVQKAQGTETKPT